MKRFVILLYTVLCTLYAFPELKYVFYFIGDGMGTNQVLGAEMYQSAIEGEPLGRVQTLMTTFPYSGHAATFSASNAVTDSPAAGTTLATGVKTNRNMLGLDKDGKRLNTITEDLKREGWGVGLMTTVAIDHATPAAFYSHVNDRNAYYEIGRQLCTSEVDFIGGAGFHDPQGTNGDRLPNLYRLSEQNGFAVAHGYNEAQAFLQNMPEPANKLIMIQSSDDQGPEHGSNLPYAIDRKEGDLTLAQIVNIAIPFINTRYERWFMMVEGGMVDYACHGDDAATAFGEVWDMDEAMRVAYDFYLEHPEETLILVTADHETGGMSLGNGGYTLHLDLLQYQKSSAWILSDMFTQLFQEKKKPSWNEVKTLYREQLGFWDQVDITAKEEAKLKELYKAACKHQTTDTKTMYKTINKLGDAGIGLLNKKAHIGWTTYSHSAHAVPIFAIGEGAWKFTGWHDNTEIIPLLRQAIEGK